MQVANIFNLHIFSELNYLPNSIPAITSAVGLSRFPQVVVSLFERLWNREKFDNRFKNHWLWLITWIRCCELTITVTEEDWSKDSMRFLCVWTQWFKKTIKCYTCQEKNIKYYSKPLPITEKCCLVFSLSITH